MRDYLRPLLPSQILCYWWNGLDKLVAGTCKPHFVFKGVAFFEIMAQTSHGGVLYLMSHITILRGLNNKSGMEGKKVREQVQRRWIVIQERTVGPVETGR